MSVTLPTPYFAPIAPSPRAPVRLFCLPHAGGGAHSFAPWRAVAPPSVDIWGLELPGRGVRSAEALETRMAPLVAGLVPLLLRYDDKPFALFGHSLGALVGFELIRSLRRLAAPLPRRLIAAGHQAPGIPDINPPLHELPHDDFITALKALRGTPAAVFDSPDLLAAVLPVLRADLAVAETYVRADEPPVPVPITVLGGDDDDSVPADHLTAWRDHGAADVDVVHLPGDHFFAYTHAPDVLRAIARALARP